MAPQVVVSLESHWGGGGGGVPIVQLVIKGMAPPSQEVPEASRISKSGTARMVTCPLGYLVKPLVAVREPRLAI